MRFFILLLTLLVSLSIAAQDSAPDFVTVDGITYDLRPKEPNKTYPYSVELKTAERETISSAKVFSKGKRPVVLVFWMTTCVPCQYELRALNEKYEEWKKLADFDLYAISMDFPRREESVYRKIASANWPWETYYDYNRAFANVMPGGLNGLPQTFLIDKNGEVVFHQRKYRMGQEEDLFNKVIDLQ